MAYKYSKGERELGDIEFEEDPGTKINFEQDYVSLETAGNPVLTVSGSRVGIGTVTPSYVLDVAGPVGISEYIRHNGDFDTNFRFRVNRITLAAGGLSMIDVEKKDAAPHEVVVNNGGNNVDLVVKGNGSGQGNPLLKCDADTNRVGIDGVGSPTCALDVGSNVIRIRSTKTPSSASDSGEQGEICWDANYLYICVAPNTWKRVALSAW